MTQSLAQPVLSLPAQRLGRSAILLIVLYGLALLLPGLSSRVLTRHETLAAQPAREMLSKNHWIIPTFVDIPRTAKPPGMMWTIAAFLAVFRTEAEWVPRLPSVLASIAIAVMIASFAARFFSRRLALFAGLIQLTCYYVLMQARLCEQDMCLAALVTASLLCFALGTIPKPEPDRRSRFRLGVGFYSAAGISFLYKGFVGIAFIFLCVGAFLLVERRMRILRFLLNPAGILVFIVGVVAWPIAAVIAYPPIVEAWFTEQVGTYTGVMGNNAPFYFYLYSIPGLLMPWTPAALVGVIVAWQRRIHLSPLSRFFLCWMIPGVVLLSFSAFKHKHYVIPLLPPLSILAAGGLVATLNFIHRKPGKPWIGAILTPLLAIGGIIAVERYARDFAAPAEIMIVLISLCVLVSFLMEHLRKPDAQVGAWFAAILAGVVCFQVMIMPRADDYRSDAEFARRVNAFVQRERSFTQREEMVYLVALKDPETQIAYYLNMPTVRRFDTIDEFLRAKHPGDSLVITCNSVAQKLKEKLKNSVQMTQLDDSKTLRKAQEQGDRFVLVDVIFAIDAIP